MNQPNRSRTGATGRILRRFLGRAVRKSLRSGRTGPVAIGRISSVVFLLGVVTGGAPARCGETAAKNTSVEERAGVVDACDRLLADAFERGEPGVAVIATMRGEVVFRNGYGMANMELGVPIRPDMVFRIGSVTKTFTATAVMILEERGLISLDEDIGCYLPGYPTHGERITVRHLLAHTSGIKNLFRTEEYNALIKEHCFRLMNDEVDLSELLDTFEDHDLEFTPGEQYRYSNSGYFLLGRIIETVSRKTYQEFLQENIFEPLGMENTRYYDNIHIVPNRVLDYLQDEGTFINNPYESLAGVLVYAAGGLMSTVDDLARFDAALYTETLVTQATVERMVAANKLNNGDTTRSGLGWELRRLKDHSIVMHGGDVYGYSAVMLRIPEEEIFVALLGNDERIHSIYLEYFANKIAAILLGDPFPEWRAITLPPDELAQYGGVYRIDGDNVRKVTVEGSRMFTQRNEGPVLEIFPASEGVFFYDKLLNYVTFEKNNNGVVRGMVMHYEDGKEITAAKE